jgi:hypothetical protein
MEPLRAISAKAELRGIQRRVLAGEDQ